MLVILNRPAEQIHLVSFMCAGDVMESEILKQAVAVEVTSSASEEHVPIVTATTAAAATRQISDRSTYGPLPSSC
jgi:hypothetical protein